MGRAPCCDKANVKKGPWSPEEDAKLKEHIEKHGTGGNWIALPQKAGLKRCGKSCRLRWLNYLRPNIKHGEFTDDEDRIICTLFSSIGSRWSIIAAQLPGRTDNDIKNYWNTKLKKKLIAGIIPIAEMKPNPAAISSFFQASPSSSSSPSPYQGSCSHTDYGQQVAAGWSFISPSSNSATCNFSSSPASALLQVPQDGFVGLNMQLYHQVQDNVLSFGGDQASCSSSDGSCSNQLSYGREMEYDCGAGGRIDGNFFYSRVEDQKPIISEGGMIGNDGWSEKQNFMWEETPLDYSLEEIKRLISTSSCNNSLSFDEYKTGERVMYY